MIATDAERQTRLVEAARAVAEAPAGFLARHPLPAPVWPRPRMRFRTPSLAART